MGYIGWFDWVRLGATGLIAPDVFKIGHGGDLRRFAIAVDFPRNLLSPNGIDMYSHTHARNLTINAKNQKTYGRLFGMIYFGGIVSMLVFAAQMLATQ
jgi:hypothetical protein